MDDNQINEMINNSIIPDSYWLSQGHNQILPMRDRLQLTRLLFQLRSPIKDNETSISNDINIRGMVNNIPEGILLHDDYLLLLWQKLGNAAASLAASSDKNSSDKLTISIVNVETPSAVMKILTSALEKLPIKKLKFENNRLCSDGLIGLTNLVRKNSSINRLYLSKNGIHNYELLSLAQAIRTTGRDRIIPWLNQISRPIELNQV